MTTSYTLANNIKNFSIADSFFQAATFTDGTNAKIYGNPCAWGNYLDYAQGDNYTGYTGVCGIVSCENILIQLGNLSKKVEYEPGADDEENNIVRFASDNEYCYTSSTYNRYGDIAYNSSSNGATVSADWVDILYYYNDYGVISTRYNSDSLEYANEEDPIAAELYDIAVAVTQDKCVIIGVDSDTLWHNYDYVEMDHAITVTGVVTYYDYSDNKDHILGYYICDSGRSEKSDSSRYISYWSLYEAFGGYDVGVNGYMVVTDDEKQSLILNNVTGNSLANYLTGNTADNTISGGWGRDTMVGGDGNDTLIGGINADSMVGGFGDDIYEVDNTFDITRELSDGGADLVKSSLTYSLLPWVEQLILTGTKNINGSGNSIANIITGNSGINTIDGKGGADILRGEDGNDTYIVDSIDVTVDETGTGIDTVRSSVSYTLADNLEYLVLTGTDAINGTGNILANTITGNSKNNTLDGSTGADRLRGSGGNDVYIVDNVGDRVSEGSNLGFDEIRASVTYTLGYYLEKLTLTGGGAINGAGNNSSNTIIGNDNNNILSGKGGRDYLDGGSGDDTLYGGSSNDTLYGGTGSDSLVGSTGNDVYYIDRTGDTIFEKYGEGTDTVNSYLSYSLGNYLEKLVLLGTDNIDGTGNSRNNGIYGNSVDNVLDGGLGNDLLDGGTGNDTLYGGLGHDKLDGGVGNDTLNGDSGNDTYVFDNDDGADIISDLAGKDRIYFNTGISRTNIAIFKEVSSTDLVIDYGTSPETGQIIVENYTTMEKLQLSNGKYLTLSNINHIIQDIANYDIDIGTAGLQAAQSINDIKSNQDLLNIIAGHWH